MKISNIGTCLVLAVALLAGANGCAYTPHHGDQLSAGNKAFFIGMATAGSLPVRIRARSASGVWYTIASTTADATAHGASSPSFSRPLYQWDIDVTVPSWLIVGGQATLAAEQGVGTSWIPMYMYDNAGWQCLVSRYIAAGTGVLDVESAGIECSRTSGTERHEITMHQ
jgi:hypothetical protein